MSCQYKFWIFFIYVRFDETFESKDLYISTYQILKNFVLISIIRIWLWSHITVCFFIKAIMRPITVIESKFFNFSCFLYNFAIKKINFPYWISYGSLTPVHLNDTVRLKTLLSLIEWSHSDCYFYTRHYNLSIN